VDLGVSVLAGLRGAHLDDLAGTTLDDDVSVLTQSRTLHGVSGGRAGGSGLEGVIVLIVIGSGVGHFVREYSRKVRER